MSFFSQRWDRCRVLTIGGTYVYLIEGETNVGGTFVGGRKVALPLSFQIRNLLL
jgi:hypothetical protein